MRNLLVIIGIRLISFVLHNAAHRSVSGSETIIFSRFKYLIEFNEENRSFLDSSSSSVRSEFETFRN